VKVRRTVPCERCRRDITVGTVAVRFHGRLWHLTCATEYIRARKRQRVA
jgi:hypothetical protein